MRVAIFCHSLRSDWNHGNAHFLRGICSEMVARGFDVHVFEPQDSWSYTNLVETAGPEAGEWYRSAYPQLSSHVYNPADLDVSAVLDGADLVLVHEWNDPELVAHIGRHRSVEGHYTLLFHDTHHRSVTDPEAMRRYDLEHYHGVLAFGESVAEVYRRSGWSQGVWVWHEAADTRVFRPIPPATKEGDLVWIGNWGDNERTVELREFLIEPVAALGLRARIHGVRYPVEALATLREAGIEYAGWCPNFKAPEIFAKFGVTVHVPRGPYARALAGVPTIRVFEALACGIPLVSAPWEDAENLFRPGKDFRLAHNGAEMQTELRAVLGDDAMRAELIRNGLETIQSRHTCAHRVDELLAIHSKLHASALKQDLALDQLIHHHQEESLT